MVHFGTQKFLSGHDNLQTLNFRVTPAMAPSVRLLVYYITYSEATSELVADAVWLDVRAKCVNGLQVRLQHSACGMMTRLRFMSEDLQTQLMELQSHFSQLHLKRSNGMGLDLRS